MHNLADDPECADILRDMEERLERLKHETGHVTWSRIPVPTIQILGPMPQDDAESHFRQILDTPIEDRRALQIGNNNYQWKQYSHSARGRFDLSEIVSTEPHETIFIAFTVELLAERDPFIRVSSTPKRPTIGCCNGEILWNSETGWINPFNPPLRQGKNTIVFKTSSDNRNTIQLAVHAPAETVRLR